MPGRLTTRCCIVGGGPAGVLLGYLLARAGVDVVVLEKHADFLRDFRGDTLHPSTLQIMGDLGLLEGLLSKRHQTARHLEAVIGSETYRVASFESLRVRCPYIAFMPQWEFLNFLVQCASELPSFRLIMQAEAVDLIIDGNRIVGVRAHTPEGPLAIIADLTIGADGRSSVIRKQAGLRIRDMGSPIDVLWLRLSRRPNEHTESLGRIDAGTVVVLINRDTYWQCAIVIPKGGLAALKAMGLDAFRARLACAVPFVSDRVAEIDQWEDVKLLTVKVDCLERWYRRGLLCVGDAAHAMSPIGGVGINLALQDAVAAARVLVRPLCRGGSLSMRHLARVQRRRHVATRLTQRLQVLLQERVVLRVLTMPPNGSLTLPWPARRLLATRWFPRLIGYVIGMGFRPERPGHRFDPGRQ